MFAFNCKVAIHGLSVHQYSQIEEIAPKHISLFAVNKIDSSIVEGCDYIVTKSPLKELMDIAGLVLNHKNSLENLIALIDKDVFDKTNLDFGQVWPKDLSDKQLVYFFKKLLASIEEKNDYDDIKEVLTTKQKT